MANWRAYDRLVRNVSAAYARAYHYATPQALLVRAIFESTAWDNARRAAGREYGPMPTVDAAVRKLRTYIPQAWENGQHVGVY